MQSNNKLNFEKLVEEFQEIGYVEKVSHPITYVRGLPKVKSGELILFENNVLGKVVNLAEDYVEAISFSHTTASPGSRAVRTGKYFEIGVSEDLLGKTIDALGEDVYDTLGNDKSYEYRKVDVKPLGIERREKIYEPFETGVSIVDMMIPLGRGQRELIIGDRKTGKTEFLYQVMLRQARKGTVCIYAGIGKQKIDIKKAEDFVTKHNIKDNTIIMAALSSDPSAAVYVAPFSAMTIAEYFRDMGRDVLLILDDLTTHAKYYREIALLGNRFPGRSAYPADIFFTHSRLLERAGFYRSEKGLSSITCLPVAETVEGDISGYIQTNLMSITDGHIFFDSELFIQGRRPAINFFLSVTRVGRQTQTKLQWSVNRELTNFLSLLEKTQSFVHFGAEINEGIKATLSMGEFLLESFFDQDMGVVISPYLQTTIFCLIWSKAFKSQTSESLRDEIRNIIKKYDDDENYRLKVHSVIDSCDDFNKLLSVISSKQSEFI